MLNEARNLEKDLYIVVLFLPLPLLDLHSPVIARILSQVGEKLPLMIFDLPGLSSARIILSLIGKNSPTPVSNYLSTIACPPIPCS